MLHDTLPKESCRVGRPNVVDCQLPQTRLSLTNAADNRPIPRAEIGAARGQNSCWIQSAVDRFHSSGATAPRCSTRGGG